MKTLFTLSLALLLAGCASQPVVQKSEKLPSTVTSIEEGWVQLFDGPEFTGRSLTIKYPLDIRKLEDVPTDDGMKGFEDKPSSVKWCLPEGYSFVLYENPLFTGNQTELKGNGQVQQINDLERMNEKGNQASSVRWLKNTDDKSLTPTSDP
jgi:hypothetical protein